MSENRPDVAVIIPVYRGAGIISRCLDKVTGQQSNRSIEVIVVDDGSDDGTAQAVSEWGREFKSDHPESPVTVQLLRQEHKGPSAALNLGAANTEAEILLFTDADCEPTPNWVEAMTRPFDDPSVCGTKGAYETEQREWVARLVQVEYEEKYERMKAFDSIDFIDTYSGAFRREVFGALGLFV